MQCPYCQAENLEKRDACYNCSKDLTILRMVTNKARHHYNNALEHAERQRHAEAITDLRSCLELDSQFISAYVVLGTIYAKQGKYDEARELWRQALALDPSALKAHEYLGKVDVVQEVGPWVRRLRMVFFIVVLLALFLAGTLVFFYLPDQEYERFLAAKAHYDEGRLEQAFAEFQSLDKTLRHPLLPEMGATYVALIDSDLKHKLDWIEARMSRREYERALEGIGWMIEKSPIEAYARRAEIHAASIRELVETDLEQMVVAYERGLATSATLSQNLASYASLFTDDRASSVSAFFAARFKDQAIEQEIARLDQELGERGELIAALTAADSLRRAHGSIEPLDQFVSRMQQELIARKTEEFNAATKRGDLAAARQLLESREEWAKVLPEDAATSIAQLWQADLLKWTERDFIAGLDKLTFRDAGRLAELTQQAAQLTDQQLAARAQAKLQPLAAKFADELWQYVERKDYLFRVGRISTADAKLMLDNVDFMLAQLEPETLRWAKDNLLFYAGAAAARLADQPRATALLERCISEHPQSRYAKFSRELLTNISPPTE
ncbi:tetratricopeptide repeat protein [Candidatus Sumerlaeota bacterium]